VFHAIAIALFGNSEIGFRAIEAAVQIATSIVLYNLVRRRTSDRAAFFAVLFYAVGSTQIGTHYLGERDVFAASLMLWSISLLLSTQRNHWALLSGLMFGLVILIRPLFLILPLWLFWIERRNLSRGGKLAFATGCIAVPLLSLVPYLLTHTLDAYYQATILFNTQLYSGFQSISFLKFFRTLYHFVPLLLFAAVGYGALRKRDANDRFHPEEQRIWVALIVTGLLVILIQRKYLEYHFAPVILALSVIAGVGADFIASRSRSRLLKGSFVVALVAAMVVYFAPTVEVASCLATNISEGHIDPSGYDGLLRIGPATGKANEDRVIQYLLAHDTARSPVEVCAYDARLRARVPLPMCSRFTMMHALCVTDGDGHHPRFQQEWRAEYCRSIDSSRAPFVVLGAGVGYWQLPPPRVGLKHDFRELFDLLATKYVYDTVFGTYEIYHRRSRSE
jgi:hypothetical protein